MPDTRENAPSQHARVQGVDPVSDTWQNVNTDGSGALLVKASIAAGGGGNSAVAIISPVTTVSSCAVIVNVTQSLSIPVNVSQTAPITVSVSNTSPIAISGTVNISAVSPLTVNVTNTLNFSQASPFTVQVSNVSPIAISGTVNISAVAPLTVQVSNSLAILVNVSQGANIPVNISAASPLTVNVTNTLNISQASPITVNVTAGRIVIRDGSGFYNIDLTIVNASGFGLLPILPVDATFNFQKFKSTGEAYALVASTDNTLANAKYLKTDSSGTLYDIPQRTSQTLLFQSQAFTTTSTINSTNTFNCTAYRALVIHLDISKVGTVTDLVIRAQFDRGSSNYHNYAKDEWTDLRYVSAQMPVLETVTIENPVGSLFRMQCFANGVSGTANQILLSSWIEGVS